MSFISWLERQQAYAVLPHSWRLAPWFTEAHAVFHLAFYERRREKPDKCLHTLSFSLSLTGPTQVWSSTWKQSSFKYLQFKRWELTHGECMPSMNETYAHTSFHNGQASYINMKVFVFAEPEPIQSFLKPHIYKSELWSKVLTLQSLI